MPIYLISFNNLLKKKIHLIMMMILQRNKTAQLSILNKIYSMKVIRIVIKNKQDRKNKKIFIKQFKIKIISKKKLEIGEILENLEKNKKVLKLIKKIMISEILEILRIMKRIKIKFKKIKKKNKKLNNKIIKK